MQTLKGEIVASTSLPLPELIYRQLRKEILSGLLQPGQLLPQEELAKRSNSSRVPLREAMSRLEADGLVVLRPRRGYAVTSLDQTDIVEIFELRMEIESHAGWIGAHSRTQADVSEVQSYVEAMEALSTDDERYVSEWSRLNYAFHEVLIASTRRKRLVKIAGLLRDAVEPYIRVEVNMTGHVQDALLEHREIFEAFRAGDSGRLSELCKSHVAHTQRRLIDRIRRRDPLAQSYSGAGNN